MNNEFREKAQEAILKLVEENNLRCEELTKQQFVNAISQAIECGDFKRLARATDNAQQIIYIPFAETERLKSRIHTLENLLRQFGVSDKVIKEPSNSSHD